MIIIFTFEAIIWYQIWFELKGFLCEGRVLPALTILLIPLTGIMFWFIVASKSLQTLQKHNILRNYLLFFFFFILHPVKFIVENENEILSMNGQIYNDVIFTNWIIHNPYPYLYFRFDDDSAFSFSFWFIIASFAIVTRKRCSCSIVWTMTDHVRLQSFDKQIVQIRTGFKPIFAKKIMQIVLKM